ncbi:MULTISPECIES: nucleotidyltransferase family protein [Pseudomonas]|uniref:nucleotidyltransferase family protein n=1 Tax=Pseudomonas TaxID=286 RepID=UPI000B59039A|nr:MULTISPECIES: nucleotidyltransferase family protein [Pseudomonas]MBS9761731.1 nucleotidyltransferase family protein [Pseudomonas mosselii]OWQ36715.1 alcohol dehydrogenase [Pseudomonas sp. DrBHI1]
MKQWEKTLISPGCTIEEAIATLDRVAVRIVMIVDGHRQLLGTLTDGDVRRALLRQCPLNTPVHQIMCTTPRTAERDWGKDRILSVMEKYSLLQLPVLDEQRRVIGLQTLHDLLNKPRLDNPVFLMAGGFGTRLRPLTQHCPKPLLKVGEKPILEIILERFISAGFHRFFISTHYMPEMIREHFGDGSQWGVEIRYVHEEQPLGTGGALGLLPQDEIDMPLFLMNGDLLTTLNFLNLLDFHEGNGAVATMCVREYEYTVPYGVVESEGHRIRSMVEKPVHKFFINAGIYLLSPELVKSVRPGTHIDMPTLLEQQIAQQYHVNMFPVHEYWLDIGRMEDFQRAQQEFSSL